MQDYTRRILDRAAQDLDLRNYTDSTRESYLRNMRRYLEFLGHEPALEDAEEDLRAWSLHLRGRGLAASSIDTYLAAVIFMYEVTLRRPLNRRLIPLPKREQALPALLTREQVDLIIDAAPTWRDKSIISLGAGSGLRRSEVACLRARDVESHHMRLLVEQGKGRKARRTLLSERSLEYLRRHWAEARPSHPEGWLFLGARGLTHVADECCNDALSRAMGLAGVDAPGVRFHTLRHCFATWLVEGGCDLLTVKELLGHSSVSSTTVYLHLVGARPGLASPLDAARGALP